MGLVSEVPPNLRDPHTMDPLRQSLLSLYRVVTSPSRKRQMAARRSQGHAPITILFYHRVADTHPNAWTMPSERFERQIDWLAERFEVISLSEAQRRLTAGRNERPAVAITFDDGYGDNCETAIPLLLRRGLPFTYFVSTKLIRDQLAFPHDLAAGVPLRPNTVAELRAMSNAGVEIGAHTRTHPDLGRSTERAWLEDEIVGSVEDLERWLGRRPKHFAFPFGLPANMSPEAMAVAHDAGVQGVCSAYGAYNLPERVSEQHGAFHLRRVHADPEWARFANWMTFDPRKLGADDPIDDDEYLGDTFGETLVIDSAQHATGVS